MKNYISMRVLGFLSFIMGLWGMLLGLISPSGISILSPTFLVQGVIFIVADTCKSKEYRNRNLYMIIVAVAIAVMLFWEYIFAPVQNRLIFFIFTVVLAIALFGMSYFMLNPEIGTKKEKILSRSVSILFVLAFFSLMVIVYNNLVIVLVPGVLITVIVVISILIRRRRILKA